MKQSIDDLFNKKLSDSKAAFNEAHWEDMAELLDNEKERKPKGYWFILSGLAALALISILAYWVLNFQYEESSTLINEALNTKDTKE